MDPIRIDVIIKNATNPEGYTWKDEWNGGLVYSSTYTIDTASQWLDIPIFNLGSEDLSQKYASYGLIAHFATFFLAVFSIFCHVMRRLCGGMKIEIKYTEVIKKFENGVAKHLTLFPQEDELNIHKNADDRNDEDEEKEKLIVNEVANDSAFEKDMVRVSEHDTEEEMSQESHYIEDEDGVITRTMI